VAFFGSPSGSAAAWLACASGRDAVGVSGAAVARCLAALSFVWDSPGSVALSVEAGLEAGADGGGGIGAVATGSGWTEAGFGGGVFSRCGLAAVPVALAVARSFAAGGALGILSASDSGCSGPARYIGLIGICATAAGATATAASSVAKRNKRIIDNRPDPIALRSCRALRLPVRRSRTGGPCGKIAPHPTTA